MAVHLGAAGLPPARSVPSQVIGDLRDPLEANRQILPGFGKRVRSNRDPGGIGFSGGCDHNRVAVELWSLAAVPGLPTTMSVPLPAAANVSAESAEPTILYFDGVCGLCNRTVEFLLKRDTAGTLRFAPLQGETARERLPEKDRASLNSLVVSRGEKSWRRSAAAVRILWQLPAPWPVVGWLLWIVPLPLRDLGYRLVARSRYRLFGKLESCRLPQPGEAERFLP